MRGGITIHHSIAYSLSNICATNYQNRLMCVEVILCNVRVVFFETQCRIEMFDKRYIFYGELHNPGINTVQIVKSFVTSHEHVPPAYCRLSIK